MLVKELRASKEGTYTTGAGVNYATSEIKQWFVMVKDVKGRFSDNPLWGVGWGWALYKPDNKTIAWLSAFLEAVVTICSCNCLGHYLNKEFRKNPSAAIETYIIWQDSRVTTNTNRFRSVAIVAT